MRGDFLRVERPLLPDSRDEVEKHQDAENRDLRLRDVEVFEDPYSTDVSGGFHYRDSGCRFDGSGGHYTILYFT